MLTLEKAQEMVDAASERSETVKETAVTVVATTSDSATGELPADLRPGLRPRGTSVPEGGIFTEPEGSQNRRSDPEGDLHSLAEVTRFLKVSENRIRHWEKSFNQVLSNHRNQYNHRIFTDTDVKILERIKFLQDSKLYTREGIIARLNSKLREKGGSGIVSAADKQFQQKLLIALNTLATEVKGLRREVREDLRGGLKKELDHLTLLLFPPKQERKWWQIFKK